MMNITTTDWGVFKFTDLFNITKGKRLTVVNTVSGDTPFLTAKAVFNGITSYIDNTYYNFPLKSDCLTIDMFGNVHLNSEAFFGDDNVHFLETKAQLSVETKLFLKAVLSIVGKKYSYGYQLRLKRLNTETIRLPTAFDGSPDWDYMHSYIKNITGIVKSTKYLHKPKLDLKVEDWKIFNLTDLFTLKNGSGTPKSEDGGIYPIVTSTTTNNGVSGYTNDDTNLISGPAITISIRGGGNAFFQSEPFVASLNALVLEPKDFDLTENVGVFISKILDLSCSKYSYGRIRSMTRVSTETIKLPVTPEGTPDWAFMEEYMKQIKGS